MTLFKTNGIYTATCDKCDKRHPTQRALQIEAVAELRKKGWSVSRSNQSSRCKTCRKTLIEKIREIPEEELRQHNAASLAALLGAEEISIRSYKTRFKFPLKRQGCIDWGDIKEGYNDRYGTGYDVETMLRTLYGETNSATKMEDVLGVSAPTIRTKLRSFGVEVAKRNNNRKVIDWERIEMEYNEANCTDYTLKEMIEKKYREQYAMRRTAPVFGVTAHQLRRKMAELDIKLDTRRKPVWYGRTR